MCAVEQLTGTCVVAFVSVVKKLVRLLTSEKKNEENRNLTGRLVRVVKLSGFVCRRLRVRIPWQIRTVVTEISRGFRNSAHLNGRRLLHLRS